MREFLRESGLIRVYHVRRPDGAGFEEKPELPFAAVDEAIVNAVAHREYGLEWATECVYYRDALVDGNQAPQPLNHHRCGTRARRDDADYGYRAC